MNLCLVFMILSIIHTSYSVKRRLNDCSIDEEHDRMPAIFSVSPYARCLRRPGGRYCTAYATYVADHHNPLLTLMQEYSEHTSSRFNHTRALIGTCITHECDDIESNMSDPRTFLERCLNRSAWERYKLRVKLDEEVFCHEHGENKLDIRAVDVAVAVTLLALVMLNIIGNLPDIYYSKKGGLVIQFLQCFSISRNWKILNAPVKGSHPRQERLKGIKGIRALSMTGVIVAHGQLPALLAAENTKFVEDLYDTKTLHVLLNGTLIMQTFLFLSGFLLCYSYQIYAETHQVTWKMFWLGITKRWLRLTPPYAIVLALIATWIPHVSNGPIWEHIVVAESEGCRSDWWQHLFYINNYYEPVCMVQTWYLATDFQLYCIGLLISICCRSLRSKKVVLTVLFVAGMAIPAVLTYFHDLNGPLVVSPELVKTLFTTDSTFNMVYKQSHTNLPSYILGLAAGYLVYSLQRNNFDAAKYKAWRPLYWSLFPLGLALMISCKAFYSSPKVYLLYRVAAAALLKPVFGLLVALTIIGMIFKIEATYRGILEWEGWVTVSRVSYSAYLLHITYIRVTAGALDHPLRLSYLMMVEKLVFTVSMTYIAAYFFWLTVEAPLAQIVNTFVWRTAVDERKQE